MFAIFLVGGVDWSQVLQAALFGAIGGALGAWIGYRLVAPRLAGKAKQTVPLVIIALFVTFSLQLQSYSSGTLQEGAENDFNQALEESLRKKPLFGIIFENHPELVEPTILRFRKAYEENGKEGFANEAAAFAREIGQKDFDAFLPYATDEAIDRYIASLIDFGESVLKRDPVLCFEFGYGGQDVGGRLLGFLSSPERIQLRDATYALIYSADKTHADTPMSEAEFKNIIYELFTKVDDRLAPEGAYFEALESPELVMTDEQKTNACKTDLEILKAINELPPEKMYPFFKIYYGGQGASSE